jgi:hypothetical protein
MPGTPAVAVVVVALREKEIMDLPAEQSLWRGTSVGRETVDDRHKSWFMKP